MTPTRRKPAAARNQNLQWGILCALIVIASVIAFVQFAGDSPAVAHASAATTYAVSDRAGQTTPASTSRADLSITWPVRIERDVFTWNHDIIQTRVQRVAGPNQQAIEREAHEHIRLQGIMLDGRPRVLANGRMLVKGDEIRGFILQEINHRHIVLEKLGIHVFMSL